MLERHLIGILFATVLGYMYYQMMSTSIPKESNCSFIANIWTDIIAFIFGGIIIYYGVFIYDNIVLTVLGTSIITEHILQFTYNKI